MHKSILCVFPSLLRTCDRTYPCNFLFTYISQFFCTHKTYRTSCYLQFSCMRPPPNSSQKLKKNPLKKGLKEEITALAKKKLTIHNTSPTLRPQELIGLINLSFLNKKERIEFIIDGSPLLVLFFERLAL